MFKNPFSFEGRIHRKEYIISVFIFSLACFSIIGISSDNGTPGLLLLLIPVFWFFLAQGAKRAHDFNKSGWWQLNPLSYPAFLYEDGISGTNNQVENLNGNSNFFNPESSLHNNESDKSQIHRNPINNLESPRANDLIKNHSAAEKLFSLGISKIKIDDFSGGISDLNKAIDINPRFERAYFERAKAKKAKLDIEGAIMDYSMVIELNPQNFQAFNNRGNLRRKFGNLDGAIEDYEKALSLNPNFSIARDNLDVVRRLRQQSS